MKKICKKIETKIINNWDGGLKIKFLTDDKLHNLNGPAIIVIKYNKISRASYYINNTRVIKKGPAMLYFSDNIVNFSFWHANDNAELVKEYYTDGSVRSIELYYNDRPNKYIFYKRGKVFDRIAIYAKQCQDTYDSVIVKERFACC